MRATIDGAEGIKWTAVIGLVYGLGYLPLWALRESLQGDAAGFSRAVARCLAFAPSGLACIAALMFVKRMREHGPFSARAKKCLSWFALSMVIGACVRYDAGKGVVFRIDFPTLLYSAVVTFLPNVLEQGRKMKADADLVV